MRMFITCRFPVNLSFPLLMILILKYHIDQREILMPAMRKKGKLKEKGQQERPVGRENGSGGGGGRLLSEKGSGRKSLLIPFFSLRSYL